MTQDSKEFVHDYYEQLMHVFRQHSGLENVERGGLSNFVSHFVLGLKPKLSMYFQQNVICWQSKPLDDIAWYACKVLQ